jgi:hypothetical protein
VILATGASRRLPVPRPNFVGVEAGPVVKGGCTTGPGAVKGFDSLGLSGAVFSGTTGTNVIGGRAAGNSLLCRDATFVVVGDDFGIGALAIGGFGRFTGSESTRLTLGIVDADVASWTVGLSWRFTGVSGVLVVLVEFSALLGSAFKRGPRGKGTRLKPRRATC